MYILARESQNTVFILGVTCRDKAGEGKANIEK